MSADRDAFLQQLHNSLCADLDRIKERFIGSPKVSLVVRFDGYWTIYPAIKRAAKETGMDYPGFGCHTFRRMHNTMFRRQVSDDASGVKLAQGQLGHSDKTTNDLYFVEDQEDVDRRAEVVARIFQKVMKETVN